MNSCMISHAKPEEEDRAREEWFATYDQRRRERDDEFNRTENRRKEVIQLMREDGYKQRNGDGSG